MKKSIFCGHKISFVGGDQNEGMETEWQRLGDKGIDKEGVSWALERILCIRRLQRSFSGAHGCSAALPHMGRFRKNFILILIAYREWWECYRFLCSSFFWTQRHLHSFWCNYPWKKINIGYSHHFIFIILLHLIISKYVEHTNLMFLSTAI